MSQKFNLKYFSKFIVVVLLTIMLILEISSALKESQTIDEAVHLASGYSYWKTGDFRMNPEHPALFKLISSFPLLFLRLNLPTDDPSWNDYNEWEFGHQFLYHNTESADKILFFGRLPTMLISLLLGAFIFKWSRELFGYKAGIFALFLYILEPNIIAHSRYATNDIMITFLFLLSIYYFAKYLKKPSFNNLLVAGLVFAIAQVIKFSAAILIPIFILLFLVKRWQDSQPGKSKLLNYKKFLLGTLVFILLTYLIIFISYGFELKIPISDPRVVKLYQERKDIINSNTYTEQPYFTKPFIKYGDPQKGFGKFLYNLASNFPVPAYSYFRGFANVIGHNYWGHGSYLLGMNGEKGWWYYFIIAFFVKTPLTILIFLVFSLILLCKKFSKILGRKKGNLPVINSIASFFLSLKKIPFDYVLLTIPPLIYFLWSLTSHINLGVRHIFPVFPFIYLISSSVVNYKPKKFKKIYNIIFFLLILFYIFTSFKIYPNYLTYFNEAVGGPRNGAKILQDSNIDWGQDIKKLKKYIDEKQIEHLRVVYFGRADLNYYGIYFGPVPNNDEVKQSGIPKDVTVISTYILYAGKDFTWLQEFKPTKSIGNSIYVYDFRNYQNNSYLSY